MKTECRKCTKPALLEACPVRIDGYEVWLPYCNEHLAAEISENEMMIRRVGKQRGTVRG